jgi:hypothetical protein
MRGPTLSERISRSRSMRSASVRWIVLGVRSCMLNTFAQPEGVINSF